MGRTPSRRGNRRKAPRFPTSTLIHVYRHRGGRHDEYGNPAPAYTGPEPVMVFAAAIGGSEFLTDQHPEAAEHTLVVYAPVSAGIGDRDRIEYGGTTYEVDGRPGNWDANPWWSPGLSEVRCKEVLG